MDRQREEFRKEYNAQQQKIAVPLAELREELLKRTPTPEQALVVEAQRQEIISTLDGLKDEFQQRTSKLKPALAAETEAIASEVARQLSLNNTGFSQNQGKDANAEAIAAAVQRRLQRSGLIPSPGQARPLGWNDPEPSPDMLAVIDEANAIIDQAILTGRWTREDGDRLWDKLGSSSIQRKELEQVMLKIMQAINRGDLTPEDPMFIFP